MTPNEQDREGYQCVRATGWDTCGNTQTQTTRRGEKTEDWENAQAQAGGVSVCGVAKHALECASTGEDPLSKGRCGATVTNTPPQTKASTELEEEPHTWRQTQAHYVREIVCVRVRG